MEKESNFDHLQNFFRLQCLLNRTGNSFLRNVFQERWKWVQGSDWENSQENAKEFLEGVGQKLFKTAQPIQKKYLQNGNIDTWDLPLLIDAIKVLQNPNEKQKNLKNNSNFDKLKKIRNQLAHAGNASVTEEEFNTKWAETSLVLLEIGVSQGDLDSAKSLKLKGEEVQAPEKNINIENTNEARRLKSVGNDHYKHHKFRDAIKAYSDAILQPSIPLNDLAILYSNRSVAFLQIKDFQNAKVDAKGAIHLRPSWWRGYSRLANAYQALEKYGDALKYNEMALSMEPTSAEVKDARDFCRHTVAKLSRQEHTDPINHVDTFEETAAKYPIGSCSAIEMEHAQKLNYRMGTGVGICGEGHSYMHGRGVAQNFEMAAKMFAKAAQKGNAEGMYNLGLLTREGKGIQRNVQEGHQWLLKAASQEPFIELVSGAGFKGPNLGVSEAQHSIGLAYQEGVGVPKDDKEALKWYLKALENGCPVSANNIAIMYGTGTGVFPNPELAFMYWKVASFLGVVRAMENLADNYLGMGDLRTAQMWYTLAVEKGSISLPLSKDKFQLDRFPLVGFNSLNFLQDLNEELLQGPLKRFVIPRETSMNSLLKRFAEIRTQQDPLSNDYKKDIILHQRKEIKFMKSRNYNGRDYQKNPAKLLPKTVFDLVGLKTICLKEMDQTKDHIYEGSVIKLCIIEDAVVGKPSILIIGQDCNGSVQRIFVYNFPQDKETQDKLGFGCQISIVNPYFRITNDHKPAIRVDDTSLLFLHATATDKNQCRGCGKSKGTLVCRKCRRAFYCSKECLNVDAQEMQHELVCIKRL